MSVIEVNYFDKRDDYELFKLTYLVRRSNALKFNGGLVTRLTGLENSALRMFIKCFTARQEDFAQYLMLNREKSIEADIVMYFKEEFIISD